MVQAVSALATHRLRSVLSGVGVIAGIATIVTGLAIADGARQAALDEIGTLGVANLYVRSVDTPVGDRAARIAPALTLADLGAIADTVSRIEAAFAARVAEVDISAGDAHVRASLVGATNGWFAVTGMQLPSGRPFTEDDQRSRRRVAVIGAALASDLFGTSNPIGARVLAGGTWYTVVGLLRAPAARTASSAIQTSDASRLLVVPLQAMDLSLGAGDDVARATELGVRLRDAADVGRAAPVIDALLRARHPDPSRFVLVVPRELLRARLSAQRTLNTMLLALGLVALVISGVGIMNIMLTTVVERTNEIGMRRAFGARRGDIIRQFALEAAILCSVGGLVGIPVGLVASAFVAWLAGWPVAITPVTIALALVLSTGVGLVFGTYPARLAADLPPAEALRSA